MSLLYVILAVIGAAAVLFIVFLFGAVYESMQALEAYLKGKPFKLGDHVVRIIPWKEDQGAP